MDFNGPGLRYELVTSLSPHSLYLLLWLIYTIRQCHTETQTDKICTELMEICIGLGVGEVKTFRHITIEPNSLGLGIGPRARPRTV